MTGQWRYIVQAERQTPPCPSCGSRLTVVALPFDHWSCTDCWPRRAWQAEWVAEAAPDLGVIDAPGVRELAG
jgi:ribosomal protein L37AE/L43A